MIDTLLNRLRQQVIFDLGNFLPIDCFKLELSIGFNGRELAWDEKWGIMAMKYGYDLIYNSNQKAIILTPRQYSAAKVLYNLGDLASFGATINSEETKKQASNNLCISLKEYVEYLPEHEIKPFKQLSLYLNQEQNKTQLSAREAIRGIPKIKVASVFRGLKWDYKHWKKNLESTTSQRLLDCRVSKGTKNKNNPSMWNPVSIGLYLLDEGVELNKIDAVFFVLKEWADEWNEYTEIERD